MTRPLQNPPIHDREPSRADASQTQQPAPAGARLYLAAALVLLAVTAAYWNSFDGAFVYDDVESIEENPHIRTLWPLSEAMSLPMTNGGQTVARRPVLSFTFALNYAVFGPEPFGYHLVNLGIHLAAALLLLGIVRRTLCLEPFREQYGGRAAGLALAVALLWAVHPLQTESVTYLVQRAESLMGMLYLLAVYCSLRGFQSPRPLPWLTVAVLACAAGMGVKEVMVTAPIIVLLYDGTFISGSLRAAWHARRAFYVALGATWLVLVPLQLMGWEEAGQDFTVRSPLDYALTQPRVVLHYLRLAVWPSALAIDYNWPTAEGAAQIVPAACVVGLLLGVTGWGLWHRAWYGFVGAWFFLILAPSSSLAALGQNLVEHRMYLSLASVVLLVVLAADYLLRGLLPGRAAQVAGGVLVLSATAALGVRTFDRNLDYHSALALWSNNVKNRPESFAALNAVGVEHYERALLKKRPEEKVVELEQAIRYYRACLRINPDYPHAHNNLGVALHILGVALRDQGTHGTRAAEFLDEARQHFQRALELDRDFGAARFNLGHLLCQQEEWAAAIPHLRQAVFHFPDRAQAHFLLGHALARVGDPSEAARHLQRSLDIDAANWRAHLELGQILLREFGRRAPAAEHLREALRLKPDAPVRELLREAEQP